MDKIQPVEPTTESSISPEQLQSVRNSIISNARSIATMGTKTVKNASDAIGGNHSSYDWWENEQSFDNDFWSVSFWDFPDDKWQIQITKVTTQNTGRSLMVSFSIRNEEDRVFPGFQIYREGQDDSYHPFKVEEFVFLDRVLRDILNSFPDNN